MIILKDVEKHYKLDHEKLDILKSVNLSIQAGSYVAITGPSGSGKSTLLHAIGGLESINNGEIWIQDQPIHQLKEAQLAKIRAEKIGYIFQQFQLLSSATALENVMMPLLKFFSNKEIRSKAEEALKRVGLGHRMHHLPSRLSGGEQQRVAIARALVTKPSILLADEPTGNLDSENSQHIISLLEDIHREGVTVILITHDQAIAERAEQTIHFLDGKVVSMGKAH
jgi:putative ABC transport system ATP-binding protein